MVRVSKSVVCFCLWDNKDVILRIWRVAWRERCGIEFV